MLHRCVNRQPIIRELLFGSEVLIQRISDTVPIRIDYGVAVQHPLFLGDIVLPYLTGAVKYTLKQSAVNGEPLDRRELKRFFTQKLRYPGRYDICFFGFIFRFGADSALLIIAANTFLRLINGDFPLNVILCSIQQIFRCTESVNRLQADGRLPCFTFFGSVGFTLFYIFLKFKLPILIGHIAPPTFSQKHNIAVYIDSIAHF